MRRSSTEKEPSGARSLRLRRVLASLLHRAPPAAGALILLAGFLRLLLSGGGLAPAYTFEFGPDLRAHWWNIWFFHSSLEGGSSPFITDLITFPVLFDQLAIWGGQLFLLVAVPLTGLMGVIGATNAALAFFLVASALCVYTLAHDASGDRGASALAALLFALSPLLLEETYGGRLQQLSVGFVALFLAHAGRFLRRGRRGNLLWALAALGLAALGYHGHLLLLAFALPVLVTGLLLCRPADGWGIGAPGREAAFRLARRAAWLGGAMGLLALPLALHLLWRVGSQWLMADGSRVATDLPVLAEWYRVSSLTGTTPGTIASWMPMGKGSFLGLALPAAALFSLTAEGAVRRQMVPWLATAAAMAYLSLGPASDPMTPNGAAPRLYDFLPRFLPFFIRFHFPYRFLLPAAVCLVVPAAVGLRRAGELLVGQTGLPATRWLALGTFLTVALVQVHSQFPIRGHDTRIPAEQEWRALEEDGLRSVLVVSDWSSDAANMRAQMLHGKPLCCTDIPATMLPAELRRLEREDLLFRFLGQRQDPARARELGSLSWGGTAHRRLLAADPEGLREKGFSHVVLSVSQPGLAQDAAAYRVATDVLTHHFGAPILSASPNGGAFAAWRVRRLPEQ